MFTPVYRIRLEIILHNLEPILELTLELTLELALELALELPQMSSRISSCSRRVQV